MVSGTHQSINNADHTQSKGFYVDEKQFSKALLRCQKLAHAYSIRIKEFLTDFDGLRSGFIHENQFKTGLSIAGLDKFMTPTEIQTLTDAYKIQKTPSLTLVAYKPFYEDVDKVHLLQQLELEPGTRLEHELSTLVDRHRFLRSAVVLDEQLEMQIQQILDKIIDTCVKRGLLVLSMFDDAYQSNNSERVFGHVTAQQFRQALRVKLGIQLLEPQESLLLKKFQHPDYPQLINYRAFANTVVPPANEKTETLWSL